ncbi:MAG TPA: hypothetical protein OIL77_00335 [Coriobacteriaceae bacterium]|nr:hypothetical protein [Coriobacteriaceae bacterium]
MKYGLFSWLEALNSPYLTATQKQSIWDEAFLAALCPELTRLPRNGLIYYVLPTTLDHTGNCEIKTAGRELADFQKRPAWSTHAG